MFPKVPAACHLLGSANAQLPEAQLVMVKVVEMLIKGLSPGMWQLVEYHCPFGAAIVAAAVLYWLYISILMRELHTCCVQTLALCMAKIDWVIPDAKSDLTWSDLVDLGHASLRWY